MRQTLVNEVIAHTLFLSSTLIESASMPEFNSNVDGFLPELINGKAAACSVTPPTTLNLLTRPMQDENVETFVRNQHLMSRGKSAGTPLILE